jgi:hypothetical protein
MMSFHIEHRPIWLVRAGHCTEVRRDFHAIIKDPCVAPRSAHLSTLGVNFAYRLGEFVKQRTTVWMENEGIMPEDNPTECLVMTSTLPRAVETADFLTCGKRRTCSWMVVSWGLLPSSNLLMCFFQCKWRR